jgi:hypothetical protein
MCFEKFEEVLTRQPTIMPMLLTLDFSTTDRLKEGTSSLERVVL